MHTHICRFCGRPAPEYGPCPHCGGGQFFRYGLVPGRIRRRVAQSEYMWIYQLLVRGGFYAAVGWLILLLAALALLAAVLYDAWSAYTGSMLPGIATPVVVVILFALLLLGDLPRKILASRAQGDQRARKRKKRQRAR